VTDKYAKLEKEYGTLFQQVSDMGVELSVYKLHVGTTPTSPSPVGVRKDVASPGIPLTPDIIQNSLHLSVELTKELLEPIPEIDIVNVEYSHQIFDKAYQCLQQMKTFDSMLKEKMHKLQ